jgi:hypothetical protein
VWNDIPMTWIMLRGFWSAWFLSTIACRYPSSRFTRNGCAGCEPSPAVCNPGAGAAIPSERLTPLTQLHGRQPPVDEQGDPVGSEPSGTAQLLIHRETSPIAVPSNSGRRQLP